MKRIVILKGPFIDCIDESVLRECLRIMFPECEIEVRSMLPGDSMDDQADNGRKEDAYKRYQAVRETDECEHL